MVDGDDDDKIFINRNECAKTKYYIGLKKRSHCFFGGEGVGGARSVRFLARYDSCFLN